MFALMLVNALGNFLDGMSIANNNYGLSHALPTPTEVTYQLMPCHFGAR